MFSATCDWFCTDGSHMDKEIFVQLFTSRVRPILEYGNVIWNPRLIRDIDAVERVQRRATKTVPGISTMSGLALADRQFVIGERI